MRITISHELLCLIAVLTLMCLVNGDDQIPRKIAAPRLYTDWDRIHFPNPKYQSHRCGRRGHGTNICDPNSILKFIQANELDSQIIQVYNDTHCPCAEFVCSSDDQNGYGIYIALVDGMIDPPETIDQPDTELKVNKMDPLIHVLERSRLFAYTQYVMWELTPCDLVIFYSTKNNVLYTIVGDKISDRLTNEIISDITADHRHYFSDSDTVYFGLKYMIADYRKVFLQEYEDRSARAHRLHSNPKTGEIAGNLATSLTVTGFLTMCMWTLITLFMLH